MEQDIYNILSDNEERLGVDCKNTNDIGGCLHELVQKLYCKYQQKVVILVDEYDKLILVTLTSLR